MNKIPVEAKRELKYINEELSKYTKVTVLKAAKTFNSVDAVNLPLTNNQGPVRQTIEEKSKIKIKRQSNALSGMFTPTIGTKKYFNKGYANKSRKINGILYKKPFLRYSCSLN